jgi:hypothetical protein
MVVENFANAAACAFGNFACSLGGTDADVFAGNRCTLSNVAGGVQGMQGD